MTPYLHDVTRGFFAVTANAINILVAATEPMQLVAAVLLGASILMLLDALMDV